MHHRDLVPLTIRETETKPVCLPTDPLPPPPTPFVVAIQEEQRGGGGGSLIWPSLPLLHPPVLLKRVKVRPQRRRVPHSQSFPYCRPSRAQLLPPQRHRRRSHPPSFSSANLNKMSVVRGCGRTDSLTPALTAPFPPPPLPLPRC